MTPKNHKLDSKKIANFIKNELPEKIMSDLSYPELKIVSEADLQSVVYYHLRRFVCQDSRWKIYNKLYSSKRGKKGVYPDIVLSRCFPKIAIELKEHKSLQEKYVAPDAEKLYHLRDEIKYGFIIYLTRQKEKGGSYTLTERARNYMPSRYKKNVTPIVINAYDKISEKEWNAWDEGWKKFSKLRKRNRKRK